MQACMNTDSRRRASAAYHAKREAEGLKKVTLWLGPEARAKLDALKVEAGSKDKAAERAIMVYGASSPGPAPETLPPRQAARARKAQAEHMQREGEAFARDMERRALDLQVGPVARKPGELLKGPKKK